MTAPRELDLVLAGATGFVGRLTAEHLARYAPAGLRIGLAGRSTDRLTRLRAELPAVAGQWPLITVDVTDASAAAALAARATVVATTVGPYWRYGLPLVQACAEAGTDYADLTGETLFARRSIDSADASAVATGARIVHSCGFDSVPSDLAVGLNAAAAAADDAGTLGRTVLHVRDARGGISGGTIDSLRQQVIASRADRSLRAAAGNPYALRDRTPGLDVSAGSGRRPSVRVDDDSGVWLAPFLMGGYNAQIVWRSDELSGGAYGPAFRYAEVIDTTRGWRGAAVANGVAVATAAFVAAMWSPITRRVLDRVLPEPGEGPSEKVRTGGRFLVDAVSETTGGARYSTRVGADLDPGYNGTAAMFGEAALALADGRGDGPGGVLTPMTALGESLAGRLRERGFTIETERLR